MTGILKKHVPGCTCCGGCPPDWAWDFATDPLTSVASGYTPDHTQRLWYYIGASNIWQWRSSELYGDDSTLASHAVPHAWVRIPVAATSFSVQADLATSGGGGVFIGILYARSMGYDQVNDEWDRAIGPTSQTSYFSNPVTTLAGGLPRSGTARMDFVRNGSNWDITYKLDGSTIGTETNVALADLEDEIGAGNCITIHLGGSALSSPFEFSVDNVLWATS